MTLTYQYDSSHNTVCELRSYLEHVSLRTLYFTKKFAFWMRWNFWNGYILLSRITQVSRLCLCGSALVWNNPVLNACGQKTVTRYSVPRVPSLSVYHPDFHWWVNYSVATALHRGVMPRHWAATSYQQLERSQWETWKVGVETFGDWPKSSRLMFQVFRIDGHIKCATSYYVHSSCWINVSFQSGTKKNSMHHSKASNFSSIKSNKRDRSVEVCIGYTDLKHSQSWKEYFVWLLFASGEPLDASCCARVQ